MPANAGAFGGRGVAPPDLGWRRQSGEWTLRASTMIPTDDMIALADALAERAGEIVRPYFRAGLAAITKADQSPVTVADQAVEEALRAMIAARFPDHGIVGEEHGKTREDAELVWTIDPIDGTRAFITGKPTFTTLIALLHRGRPVLGVIDQPITRDRWIGAAGRPTVNRGAAQRVRVCSSLAEARVSSTGPQYFDEAERRAFEAVSARCALLSWGGDGYQYGLVAAGTLDLVIENGLKLHDWAALAPVIEGAGGVCTDWKGRPLEIGGDGSIVAAGDARVHSEALAVLA